MAMNTPYLGSSATVPANLNTSYLSTGLTEITSALSVWGPVTFLGTMPQFSTISASVGTFSSNVSIGGTLAVGGGATVKAFDSILTSMAAIGVPNQGTTEVQVAFPNSAVTDQILVGYPSALSTGLIACSYVSSAGTVVLRVINASASTATEAAKVWRFDRIGH